MAGAARKQAELKPLGSFDRKKWLLKTVASLMLLFGLLACNGTPSSLPGAATAQSAATSQPRSAESTASPARASLPAASPTAARAGPLLNVKSVVDGDTIRVDVGGREESIRIIGINTPEIDPRRTVQCFGREASAKTHELLDGKRVRLVADPTQGDRDTYSRLLRYVDREDGLDVGLELIRGGFAHEFTYDLPYLRQAPYRAAEASARRQAIGFWGPTCGGNTTEAAATPTSAGARPTPTKPPSSGTTRAGVPPASKDDCPTGYPVKGNRGSNGLIYHEPGRSSYAATDPEECFATAADAAAAGYRAPND
jgi:micrococcal nuclease